jgi:hypothetical protein
MDIEGSSLAAEWVSGPSHGELTLNEDGSFLYKPEDGFAGQDTFSYRAYDGSLYSEVADVAIFVEPDPFKYIYLPLLNRP